MINDDELHIPVKMHVMRSVFLLSSKNETSAWFHGDLLVRLSNNAQWLQPTIYSELQIKCTMLVMANPFFLSHEIFNISSICLLFINAQLRFGTFYKRVFFSSNDTQSKKYNHPISFRLMYNCFKLNFRT